MACVTHLVELDFAISQFRDRGARVLAISADSPESSRRRLNRFGDFRVPLLSDPITRPRWLTASGSRCPAPTRTTASLCTARSSSTVTAWSAGPMSAIVHSGTLRRYCASFQKSIRGTSLVPTAHHPARFDFALPQVVPGPHRLTAELKEQTLERSRNLSVPASSVKPVAKSAAARRLSVG